MRILLIVMVLVSLVDTSQLNAGTLGRVRGQVNKPKKNNGAKKAKQERNRDRDRRNDDDDDDDDSVGTAIARGVLASVSQVSRKDEKVKRRPAPRQNRNHGRNGHRRRPHRHIDCSPPRRSPLSFGLSVWDTPAPRPYTVVEEHHYYGPEPVNYVVAPAAPAVAVAPPEVHGPSVITHSPMIAHDPMPQAIPAPVPADNTLVVVDDEMTFYEPWHVRFGAEYGTDTDDLSRLGFDFVANRTAGIGIDTGLRIYRESGSDFRDHLWLGDFNVTWELFPTQHVRTRAGIGFNWLSDRYGSEGGLNLTLGSDLLLTEHVVVTGEVDFGTLGDADLFHGRVTAGYRHGPIEWFAGYDHLDIGGVEIRGLIGGMRFRF